MALRRTLLAGLLAGVIAGIFATGLQAVRVAPLILAAEVYESAAPAPVAAHEHAAADAAWEPADGLERTGFSLLANIVIACGFGLLLAGGFAWREAIAGSAAGAGAGFAWGLAGFATFSLAPALGLPPAPPGSLVADLGSRQVWWLFAVASTGAAIGIAAYARSWAWRALSVPVAALPHLLGAPAAPGGVPAVPSELATEFALASLVTAGLFWILLGTVDGWFYRRLGQNSRA